MYIHTSMYIPTSCTFTHHVHSCSFTHSHIMYIPTFPHHVHSHIPTSYTFPHHVYIPTSMYIPTSCTFPHSHIMYIHTFPHHVHSHININVHSHIPTSCTFTHSHIIYIPTSCVHSHIMYIYSPGLARGVGSVGMPRVQAVSVKAQCGEVPKHHLLRQKGTVKIFQSMSFFFFFLFFSLFM
jgi:hypothetical protein